jgi:hypothetical protein
VDTRDPGVCGPVRAVRIIRPNPGQVSAHYRSPLPGTSIRRAAREGSDNWRIVPDATADFDVNFITLGDPPQRLAGTAFPLRIGVGNSGPDTSHYRLRLLLPAGARLVDAGDLGCTGTGDLSCQAEDAPAGYSSDGRVIVVAEAPGSYTFVARVTEMGATDATPANNEASLTVNVVAGARVLVAGALAVKPAKPRAGSSLTLSFRVTDPASGRAVVPSAARCSASPGRVRARVVGGRATCKVTTPVQARGKTVRGVLIAIIAGRRLSRSFSITLR